MKAITGKEFQNKLNRKYPNRFLLVGKYTNSETRTDFKCCICKHIIHVTPHTLMRSGICKYCSANNRRKTTESFNKELHKKWGSDYTLLDKYPKGDNAKAKFIHNKCGNTFMTVPSYILFSGSGCPYCKKNGPKLKTTEQFKEQVAKVNSEYGVLGKYQGVNTKIKFIHLKCGTTFITTPNHFLEGDTRCPVCTHKPKLPEKDFIKYVDSLNGEYTVLSKYVNSSRKVKFKHTTCGNIFEMQVFKFIHGERCPKCFGTPKHTQAWFENKVNELLGSDYQVLGKYNGINSKIKMHHTVCNHDFYICPYDIVSYKRGCIYCRKYARYTQSKFEDKVKSMYGNEYTVVGIYKTSHDPIAIKHNICGKIFYPAPSNFLNGARCRYCYGNIKHTQQWYKDKVKSIWGNEYEIISKYQGLGNKVVVRHKKCGNLLKIRCADFLRGNGCHYCTNFWGEKMVDRYLKKHGINSPHPVTFNDLKDVSYLSYDFQLPNGALIELQGKQHYYPQRFSSNSSDKQIKEKYELQKKHDQMKYNYAKEKGIKLYRIPWYDKYHKLSILFKTLDKILKENNLWDA